MRTYLSSMVVEKEILPMFTEQGQIVECVMKFHHFFFWIFRPCINGFQYYKPIAQVSGTWLYRKYKGTLLMAIAQDGNNKIFQIAFVIVEGEIADAWLFFLNNLKMHVTPQNGLCLISDRHESIKNVYSRHDSGWMPENSMHVLCI